MRPFANGVAIAALCSVLTISSASPQGVGAALTIGAVKDALSSTLADFNNTITTANEAVKGAGNSLQANAQNVIRDIDRVFGKNVNLTFDRMDTQQQALYRDAQRLTQQIRQATTDVATTTGDQARRTIYEADITAYNSLYSLPCRTQPSRIVYVTPNRIRVGRDTAEFSIRGNFLGGPSNGIFVDGKEATVIARSPTEIRVAVPQSVLNATNVEHAVGVRVGLVDIRKTNFLVACHTSTASREESVAVTLAPKRTVSLSGWIEPTSLIERTESRNAKFESGKDDNCDSDRDITQNICVASPWTIKSLGDVAISSLNGGGFAGPATLSGDTCFKVPGRAKGKGYDSILGVKNCKGRGWTNWSMNYVVRTDDRVVAARHTFQQAAVDQASWNFSYPNSTSLREPRYRYTVRASVTVGNQVRVFDISDAQQLSGPISARLIDGTLTVSYDETVDD